MNDISERYACLSKLYIKKFIQRQHKVNFKYFTIFLPGNHNFIHTLFKIYKIENNQIKYHLKRLKRYYI